MGDEVMDRAQITTPVVVMIPAVLYRDSSGFRVTVAEPARLTGTDPTITYDTEGVTYYRDTDHMREVASDPDMIELEPETVKAWQLLADAVDAWEAPDL